MKINGKEIKTYGRVIYSTFTMPRSNKVYAKAYIVNADGKTYYNVKDLWGTNLYFYTEKEMWKWLDKNYLKFKDWN